MNAPGITKDLTPEEIEAALADLKRRAGKCPPHAYFDRLGLDQYQDLCKHTACYPTDGLLSLLYPALGLAGETGEVIDKIKKVVRRRGEFTPEVKAEIARELGDVLWYIAALSQELGFKLEDVAYMNLEKLADRKARGVVKGEGDNR